jgi:hypothetical protein
MKHYKKLKVWDGLVLRAESISTFTVTNQNTNKLWDENKPVIIWWREQQTLKCFISNTQQRLRGSKLYGNSSRNCLTRHVLNKKLWKKYDKQRTYTAYKEICTETHLQLFHHVHSNKSTNTRCCQDCQGCWEEISKHTYTVLKSTWSQQMHGTYIYEKEQRCLWHSYVPIWMYTGSQRQAIYFQATIH